MIDLAHSVGLKKNLIVNADDFGLTKGVSAGIVRAMCEGIVSSTTAMMCRPGTAADLRQWSSQLAGRIGVHLQLTDGTPCSDPAKITSLVNRDGLFPRFRGDLKKLNGDEVIKEWRAQMERFLACGLEPSHIDSHHHVHKTPVAFAAYCEIAHEYEIPARSMDGSMSRELDARGIACPAYCETAWHHFELTPATLVRRLNLAFVRHGNHATLELMCHPAFADEELTRSSTYVRERDSELQLLCNPELAALLREAGIKVISPSELNARGQRQEAIAL